MTTSKEKKILLDKDKLIVFMGSMNAFPMMYALQLRKYGYDVLYFVDAPKSDTLSRPENHYPDVNYPYPDWIIEWTLPLQAALLLSPKLFAMRLQHLLRRYAKKGIGCYVLNGFFISLSPYLQKATFVALSHGSDLDVWANSDGVEGLQKGIFGSKTMRLIPKYIQSALVRRCIAKQKAGFMRSHYLLYLPPGFNKTADKIIAELQQAGVIYIPRIHASFSALTGQNREYRENSATLRIFSGVRFLYRTFPRGNAGYNKGNDKIIKGIAKYYKINKNIKIDFVEKGSDLASAKLLCRELGLDAVITWHKEMPFKKLLELYQQADICFDQVGDHWIGSIGIFALWLGKPLVADDKKYIDSGVWPKNNPICSAKNSDEIYKWLCILSKNGARKKISIESKLFADRYIDIENFPNAIWEII